MHSLSTSAPNTFLHLLALPHYCAPSLVNKRLNRVVRLVCIILLVQYTTSWHLLRLCSTQPGETANTAPEDPILEYIRSCAHHHHDYSEVGSEINHSSTSQLYRPFSPIAQRTPATAASLNMRHNWRTSRDSRYISTSMHLSKSYGLMGKYRARRCAPTKNRDEYVNYTDR